MTTELHGKVAVITGASKGIGRAIALAMASEGARLALCARDEAVLKQTADDIQARTHADLIAVKANMTKVNDIRRLVDATVKKFNRIDILVNNAGGAFIGGIFRPTDEEWDYHVQLKLLGYIRMAREVIPHMKAGGGGKIINIVGTAAREPSPLYLLPGVTNGGLLNFTKSLAKELEADKITVNCVSPGTTDTPLTEETFKTMAGIFQKTPEEIKASVEALSPLGRLATPEEIAAIVVFLSTNAASLINGISINADAGRILGAW